MGAWDSPPTADELAQVADPWAKPPTPVELGQVAGGESAARGALQGLSFGWGDEGAAAIAAALPFTDREAVGKGKTLAERYRAAREFYRGKNAAAKEAGPKTYLAGEIGGSIPTALLPLGGIAKGATLATRVAKGAKAGAALGALSGAGASEADSAAGVASDAALGGALGTAFGGGLPLAGAGIRAGAAPLAGKLRGAAITQGRKALSGIGTALSARKPIDEAAVQQALDSGAIRPLASVTGIAKRLEGQADELGAKYGQILEQLEASGVKGPNAVLLARKLATEAQEAARTSLGSERPRMLSAAARELPTKVSPAPFAEKRLGLLQAEDIKRGLQTEARREYDKITRQYTTAGETKKEIAAMMRQAIEDAVEGDAAKARALLSAPVPPAPSGPVLYHGTNASFRDFRPQGDMGIHFTPSRETAQEIAQSRYAEAAKAGFGADSDGLRQNGARIAAGRPRVVRAHVDIKNPLDIPDMVDWHPGDVAEQLLKQGVFSEEEAARFAGAAYSKGPAGASRLISMLRSKGYDGFRYVNDVEGGGMSYAAFHPSQIAAATDPAERAAAEEARKRAASVVAAADRFVPTKRTLSLTLEALKAAEEGAARSARRKPVSLSSTIVGSAAGAAAGSPVLGLLTALGHGVADKRLASTLASAANKGASVTSKIASAQSPALSAPASRLAALIAALEQRGGLRLAPAGAEEEGP